MLLEDIFAKNYDPTEYEKKVLVNVFSAGEEGLNIKSLFPYEPNDDNLAGAKEQLLKRKMIEETNLADFYVITDNGKEVMKRASLLDDNDELIMSNAQKYLYDDQNGE